MQRVASAGPAANSTSRAATRRTRVPLKSPLVRRVAPWCHSGAVAGGAAQHVMLAMAGCHRYIASMDTAPRPDDRADALDSETEAERRHRLAWEAERIGEAEADIAAGRLVDSARV